MNNKFTKGTRTSSIQPWECLSTFIRLATVAIHKGKRMNTENRTKQTPTAKKSLESESAMPRLPTAEWIALMTQYSARVAAPLKLK